MLYTAYEKIINSNIYGDTHESKQKNDTNVYENDYANKQKIHKNVQYIIDNAMKPVDYMFHVRCKKIADITVDLFEYQREFIKQKRLKSNRYSDGLDNDEINELIQAIFPSEDNIEREDMFNDLPF